MEEFYNRLRITDFLKELSSQIPSNGKKPLRGLDEIVNFSGDAEYSRLINAFADRVANITNATPEIARDFLNNIRKIGDQGLKSIGLGGEEIHHGNVNSQNRRAEKGLTIDQRVEARAIEADNGISSGTTRGNTAAGGLSFDSHRSRANPFNAHFGGGGPNPSVNPDAPPITDAASLWHHKKNYMIPQQKIGSLMSILADHPRREALSLAIQNGNGTDAQASLPFERKLDETTYAVSGDTRAARKLVKGLNIPDFAAPNKQAVANYLNELGLDGNEIADLVEKGKPSALTSKHLNGVDPRNLLSKGTKLLMQQSGDGNIRRLANGLGNFDLGTGVFLTSALGQLGISATQDALSNRNIIKGTLSGDWDTLWKGAREVGTAQAIGQGFSTVLGKSALGRGAGTFMSGPVGWGLAGTSAAYAITDEVYKQQFGKGLKEKSLPTKQEKLQINIDQQKAAAQNPSQQDTTDVTGMPLHQQFGTVLKEATAPISPWW